MMKIRKFIGFTYPTRPYFAVGGIVGCGKSTQMRLLEPTLRKTFLGREILFTHEPGDSPIADDIRNIVQVKRYSELMTYEAEAALYASSRAQTVHSKVVPVLKRGGIVGSDRSVDTSLTYQGWGRGLGINFIVQLNKPVLGEFWPSRVFLINTAIETCLPRAKDKLGDKFEEMGEEFFARVIDGYLWLAEHYPDIYVKIDGNGTIDQVHERLKVAVINFLREEAGI